MNYEPTRVDLEAKPCYHAGMNTETLEAPVEAPAKRTLADVVNALGSLSTEAIRDLLYAQGIKGIRGSRFHCPVARYLNNLGFSGACVGCNSIQTPAEYAAIPTSVFSFAVNFDNGYFPELNGGNK
jgi:hypothetical protein